MKKLSIILILFGSTLMGQTTSVIDSLKSKLKENKSEKANAEIKLKLAQEYYKEKDDQGIQNAKEAILSFEKLGDKLNLAFSYSILANYKDFHSEYNEAIENNMTALHLFEEVKNYEELNFRKKNLGAVYYRMHKYDVALKYFNEALRYFNEKGNNQKAIAGFYNNIGLVYEAKQQLDSALQMHQKALEIRADLSDKDGIANCRNNIGNIYYKKKQYKDAIVYYEMALNAKRELGEEMGIINALHNLGFCYSDLNEFEKAKTYIKEELEICEKIGNLEGTMEAMFLLSGIAVQEKDFEKAYFYMSKSDSIERAIYNEETNKQVVEMEAKYQNAEKEKQLELNRLELNRRNIVIYSSIGGLILIAIFAAFVYKGYRQKLRDNRIIVAQKNLMEKKNILIEEQKAVVEEKNKEITDSIAYAKRIQTALLSQDDLVEKYYQNDRHFTFFQPKDIVSGDFYWSTETKNEAGEDLFYLACCDSTGHGVPGSFMSILSMGFLSEAIKEKCIYTPGDILNYVRERLINTISREGQQDGFDGILFCLNAAKNEYTYASANNKPILVRNGEYKELDGDKMPVGKGIKEDLFKTYDYVAQKGDSLYFYTDGYADQFGGPKGKKFKYKRLNELLVNVSVQSSEKQKEILNHEFVAWKGELEQVDDVLIMGLKF